MEHQHKHHVLNEIKKLKIFSEMTDFELAEIVKHARIIRLKKQEMLFYQGDLAEKCYINLDGAIKVYLESLNNTEPIISITASGEIVGNLALDENAKFLTSAQALQDAKILVIPTHILKKNMKAYPQLSTNLIATLSQTLNAIVHRVEQHNTMSAPQRVGCYILKQFRRVNNVKKISLPLQKRDIASQLQMTPETFSRALDSLKKIGVTFSHQEIELEDIQKLVQFSCTHCARITHTGEESCSSYFRRQLQDNSKKNP